MKPKTLSFRAWVERYKPVKNPFDSHTACAGLLFDKFGPEGEFVKQVDPSAVWSLTITDGLRSAHWTIGNGFSVVNLHGYLVTAKPWQKGELLVVRY